MTDKFLNRYTVILLDMNGTFMFDGDRFGDSEDFFDTYRKLGGSGLDRKVVNSAIRDCYRAMLKDYENSSKHDDFPSLDYALRKYGSVEDKDIPLLKNVFAHHERGHVPLEFAQCLKRLNESHKLGLLSNIWAKKDLWLAEFETVGIANIWRAGIFSSDTRSVKPSPKLFQQALESLDSPLSDVVFVGDSLRVDIEPAKSIGLDTVWINSNEETHLLADRVVTSLLDLEQLNA
jgi:putative hydrolase of the HAD superfamily